MKKRLLALALSLVMVASCVACGGSDKETKTAENTTNATEEAGSNTVVVAMGGGFSTLDPGYSLSSHTYRNLHLLYSGSSVLYLMLLHLLHLYRHWP